MGIRDYFRSVATLAAEKIRSLLDEKKPGEFNLVDVRQPQEYERGRLRGADLIPVGELEKRMKELDPSTPMIAYWASGGRSRAAAAILGCMGFKEVYSMQGGIHAWKGMVASGAPEAGIPYFPPGSTPAELTELAWVLENGTRKFYWEVASWLKESETKKLFQELVDAEERHKQTLYKIYLDLTSATADANFPGSALSSPSETASMEGGVELAKALDWAKDKNAEAILEFSLSLEINSDDLYLKMEQTMKDQRSKQMFVKLAEEEKAHLHRLQELFLRMTIPS
jgi:rhodanese-related sulfurtransferase/rubrerythrin